MNRPQSAHEPGAAVSAGRDGDKPHPPYPLPIEFAPAWARLYTRGLPHRQRARRLAELEADLHDHLAYARSTRQQAADTSFEVLLRVLLGVPADLSWRWGITRGARPGSLLLGRTINMGKRVLIGLGVAASVLFGAYFVLNGVGILLGGGEGGESLLPWGVIELVSGLLLLAGPAMASRQPRVGATMIVLGTVVIAVTHVWLIAVNIPIGAALIAAAIIRSRRIAARRTTAIA